MGTAQSDNNYFGVTGLEQNSGIQLLEKAIKSNIVPHGVVLESNFPQLIKKYTELLCQWAVCNGEIKPCGHCVQCRKVSTGSHPDVYTARLYGKSQVVNVDEIRSICADAFVKPNESNIKVYIIPNADKMQPQAQNAFLKILEEPPQNILFILCCTSAQQLLGTILSRTAVYSLNQSNADENLSKSCEAAGEIAVSLCKTTSYELLRATGRLTDRAFAKETIDRLIIIVNEAIVAKLTEARCSAEAEVLRNNIATVNLIKIIDTLNLAKARLNSNINMNLFMSWLCVELRRQK